MLDFSKILKRSWNIVKENRFLWGLGIIASLLTGGGNSSSFRFPMGGSDKSQNANVNIPTVTQIEELIPIIIVAVLVAIIVCLIVLYFGQRANAGLIKSVEELESTGKKLGFKKAFKEGKTKAWQLIGLTIVISLMALICIVVVGLLGIATFVAYGAHVYALAVPLTLITVILVIILVPLVMVLGVVSTYAQRLIVLKNASVFKSVSLGWKMIKNNKRNSLFSFLIMWGISLLYAIALLFVVLLLLAVIVAVGFGLYFLAGMWVTIVYGGILGLVFMAAAIFVGGIFYSFVSTFWTLVFRSLKA